MSEVKKMPRETLVAIGMPVFNGAQYLEEAVTSLLNQTQQDFAILVSDNASTDATPEIGERLMKQDPRITFVRQEKNMGPARNFAYVLRNAQSPFFMWAAHDDLWAPDFLSESLATLDQNPDAIASVTAVTRLDASGEKRDDLVPPVGLASRDPVRRGRSVTVESAAWIALYSVFRRDFLSANANFQALERIPASDMALVFDLALRGRFAVCERPLRTDRIVGYEEVLDASGRPVWEKELGPDGRYYSRRLGPTSRCALRFISSAPLSTTEKAQLSAHVVATWWWRSVREDALLGSRTGFNHALQQRKYLRAGWLALRAAVLWPGRALDEARRATRGRRP